MSSRLPSAPEYSSAVPSCRSAAHCNLTGRRVVDEVLLRDTPPDSSLRPTVGPGLLRDSSPGNGQPRRSIGTAPSSSDDLSPPGRAELYPPAWVRQPTSDRSYRRCRRKDISVLTCVDREDRVAEAVHPRVRPDPQVRPTREVTPPRRSLVGYGRPAHAGTCPTAPSRSTHTLPPGSWTGWNNQKRTAPPGGGRPACALPRARPARTLLISWESEWNEEQQGWWFSHTAVPHNAALPDSNVSTSATLETSVANVSGWSEKNREHFVRNALQRLGSPAYISGAGSLGSCWGLWFPGMEKLGWCGWRSGWSQ